MSGFLLDVNVLIALIDPSHVHHDRAHRWFRRAGRKDWLSCPTTQNGVVRIVSNPKYPNSQTPGVVIDSLRSLLATGKHRFATDRISMLDDRYVDAECLLSSAQVTDTYLIAIARSHRAQLATLDARIVTSAVRHAESADVLQIPS